jgi:hypothetical protein
MSKISRFASNRRSVVESVQRSVSCWREVATEIAENPNKPNGFFAKQYQRLFLPFQWPHATSGFGPELAT